MEKKVYCVYQHVCPNGKVYIGITKNVKLRWFQSDYKKHNTPFKDAIIEFGWKNIKHEILFSNLTRDEALKIEGELILKARENGTSLNVNRSGRYQQTESFKEEKNARSRAWQKANRERHNANSNAWNKAHPEYHREYYKAYRESHREEINLRMREYRKRKKEEKQEQKKGLF